MDRKALFRDVVVDWVGVCSDFAWDTGFFGFCLDSLVRVANELVGDFFFTKCDILLKLYFFGHGDGTNFAT
jgi:hypothetical protein